MSKHSRTARRAFVFLFLVSIFFLAAGSTTPAYATTGTTEAPFGDYISGFVYDDTSTPVFLSYSDGNVDESIPGQTLAETNLSDSQSTGYFSHAAGSMAMANLAANSWSLTSGADLGSGTEPLIEAVAGVGIWDTIYTSYSGVRPTFAAIVLSGSYAASSLTGAAGATDGTVNLFTTITLPGFSPVTNTQTFDVPNQSSGTFQLIDFFSTDATEVQYMVTAGAAASGVPSDVLSGIEIDPMISFDLPEGLTYYSASGAEYPSSPLPEPTTMTLLGLGLVGLVAKVARRKIL